MTFGPRRCAAPADKNIDGAAAILPPMRFITANLNGVRSAASKGFFDWLAARRPTPWVCRSSRPRRTWSKDFASCGSLQGAFHYAEKKGYSGVGLYTKETPSDVITGVGIDEFDREGRWVEKRFDKARPQAQPDQRLLPSGSSGEERQQVKFRFLDAMYPHLLALKAEREFILVADVNIAQEIDLRTGAATRRTAASCPRSAPG